MLSASTFLKAMRQYSRVRRRDGAYQWGIYRDIEVDNRFVEIFLVGRTGLQLRRSRTEKRDLRVLQVSQPQDSVFA
jgi:Transmembrane secretion effector